MQKAAIAFAALLLLWTAWSAQAQVAPGTISLRYSEQISNGPAGFCGCFGLQGAAADAGWRLNTLSIGRNSGVGLAADFGVVHTGSDGGAPYGLTLTTLTAGPRFNLSGRRLEPFAQALFGLAHGSGSAFPRGDRLAASANSFALDIGGGADYRLRPGLSLRLFQLDYLRTGLPNSSTNWQNNLRIGAGFTLHAGTTAKR